jgi:hypothetical protein
MSLNSLHFECAENTLLEEILNVLFPFVEIGDIVYHGSHQNIDN